MSSWEPLLERVVRERYPRLVTHAMLVAGSAVDAQDLVQEALISSFSGRAKFRSVEQAEAYVRRAIVSRAVDESRRRSRESRLAQRVAGLAVLPVVVEERGPGADMLRALSTLSPRERACVVLRQLDDLSVTETAAQLGLSEGSVKRYTADGIARLNAVLGSTASTVERISVQQVDTQEVRDGK